MKVCVLSSGSKGNSTLVITDKVKILIDLGTTTSYVEAELNNLNIDVKEISYILITHSHVDHIKGLKVFIKRYNPVILVTEDMKKILEKELGNFRYEYYEDKKAIIDDLTVNVIKTSHDAEESIGFVLTNNNSSMVYITDTGYINQKYFKKCEVYFIMGSDNFEKMSKWKDYNKIKDQKYIVIKRDKNVISSTKIREMIAKNDSEAQKYLSREVYKYIEQNKLYKL